MKQKKFGIIDGYYGNPWGHEERMDMISFMGTVGLNTYVYGPKNDKKHRDEWRSSYTERELNNFREVIARCQSRKIQFFFTLGTGVDMAYSGQKDFEIMMDKFRKLYDLGCRGFGLLLDDIATSFKYQEDNGHFDDFASAHAYICNKAYEVLKEWNEANEFIMCPTDYHTSRFSDYMTKVGKLLHRDIDIFWTGYEVCSPQITGKEAAQVQQVFQRKPLIWDNYPVNDLDMKREMHIGPYMKRDAELIDQVSGIILNTMAKPEATKISLRTFKDYLEKRSLYDPYVCWDNALKEIGGENDFKALKIFAENSLKSCLCEQGAPVLRQKVDDYLGDVVGAKQALIDYLEECISAGEYLICHMQNKRLLSELEPWFQALKKNGEVALKVLNGDKEEARKYIKTEKERLLVTDHEIDRLAERILKN